MGCFVRLFGKRLFWNATTSMVCFCFVLHSHFYQFYFCISDNKNIESLPTIESELLKSFHQVGLITDEEYNFPSKLHFQRAARTDKGVSAIRQIISLKFAKDFNAFLPQINELLPKQIQLFCTKRVTNNFDSKNYCDARTYSYLLPSFAICPLEDICQESYRTTNKVTEEFNSILKLYTGTHNFHNFTAGKKPTDPSANRYIMSFECSDTFELTADEIKLEFLVARIKGQSFMLHQIRKMIGLAIAVMRGFSDQSTITRAFGQERLDIPMAPSLGLLLEEIHYDRYNKKWGGDGVHEPLLWDEVNNQINDMKFSHIYPNIAETEIREKSMLKWLSTLPLHTFDVREDPINDHSKVLDKPLVVAYFNANKEKNSDKTVENSETNSIVQNECDQITKDEKDEREQPTNVKRIKLDTPV